MISLLNVSGKGLRRLEVDRGLKILRLNLRESFWLCYLNDSTSGCMRILKQALKYFACDGIFFGFLQELSSAVSFGSYQFE